MRQLVEFALEGGDSVLVQVDGDGVKGGTTRGLGDRAVARAHQSFEQAVGRVLPAVAVMMSGLRELPETPDEIQLEFGVQLSAEAGAYVAAVSSVASFRVTMTWSPQALDPVRAEDGHRREPA